MAMIERARWSDLTFAWFTADEEFGQNPGLRDYLEEAEIAYVMAIPKTTEFTDHAGRMTFIEKRAPGSPRTTGNVAPAESATTGHSSTLTTPTTST
jgi:hypothetical protein